MSLSNYVLTMQTYDGGDERGSSHVDLNVAQVTHVIVVSPREDSVATNLTT